MRIVAGKYRRRKLFTNPGQTTRPITDYVKETLFQHIEEDIWEKRVADVFAGTGTLGLESLSRGAAGVVFIEHDRKAFELLRKNVAKLEVEQETLCWRADALKCSYRPKGVEHLVPFDVIFFDPPYRMISELMPGKPLFKALERIGREDVSTPNALLILRTQARAEFELPDCWKLQRRLDISGM
ncbi:MAG: 16S rRNA (guanine(966)-N(2))-methyltransferase RsmD, partial [Planctomycetes bacterium]|nr:16S rRNA (guanine(966)-N(2))-methyltransferase RsmD [Planctomycetota bacterium]